mmetsp:Transcript_96705/g.167848  ORF Transcript_96705/g.167848 Transcript_96705/m.167848 type:complete len:391 (-) Transcript_96705:283-1455(-)
MTPGAGARAASGTVTQSRTDFLFAKGGGCSPAAQPQPRPLATRTQHCRAVVEEGGLLEGGAGAHAENGCKGVISMLQEFVQSSKQCPSASNRPILQWSHETRMVDSNLEFRAKVAFLLDRVPHHVVGFWQNSKKIAKRDAAERALVLFVRCWGARGGSSSSSFCLNSAGGQDARMGCPGSSAPANIDEAQKLEEFCRSLAGDETQGAKPPHWTYRQTGQLYQAFVEIELLGVPHTFTGRPQQTHAKACTDTAECVLWYLQCPDLEGKYDVDDSLENEKEIPTPPENWMKYSPNSSEHQVAEQKTVIMRIQNRLQQAYTKQIEAGKSAIRWSFERLPGKGAPILTRATAHIEVAGGRSFTGGWHRAQRDAQIDTCQHVSAFLDSAFPRVQG